MKKILKISSAAHQPRALPKFITPPPKSSIFKLPSTPSKHQRPTATNHQPINSTVTMHSEILFTGTYSSPDNAPFEVTYTLVPPQTNPPIAEKTAYLGALREVVTEAQAQINKELTARMEEDKARDAASSKNGVVDDAKEEENYGEEVQEDED
ncbi:hypothetical protein B0T10DRAFT_584370 [Thelonectria olida]|uniref:EKC/KEOPS complex subunit GON7 n=1 Tax=Thelonectria olida TaxID=1576542 RepID=A0A9P8VUU2_9HYPO|nr:hypothetical protein B0T10DRAFT_584370 [Thelonectria olida]